MLGQKQR